MGPSVLLLFTLVSAPPATPIADAVARLEVRGGVSARGPVGADTERHRRHGVGFKVLNGLNIAIMGADVGGTMAAVETGKVREVNPLQRWIVERDPILAGLVNGAQTAGLLWGLDRLSQEHPRIANVLLAAWAATRGYVALKNNREVYKRARGR